MTDTLTIFLKDLVLHGRHGVFEQERVVGNEFRVNLEVETPVSGKACENDELSGTISYADLFSALKAEFDRPSQLLEHVAARILEALHKRWPAICRATITIEKSAPPIPTFIGTAGITLTRHFY